jgi:hypothetical protein
VARDALIAMLNQAEVLDVYPCLCTRITMLLPCCKDTYPMNNQEIIPVTHIPQFAFTFLARSPSAGSRELLCKWLKELAVRVIADALFDLAALNQTVGSIWLNHELSAGSQREMMHTHD